MANVLFLTLVFPPDSVSTAQIMGELAVDLRRSHDVMVVTTAPHYNRDPDAEERQPRRRRLGSLLQTSEYHGIRVFHTWMPQKGGSIVGRLLAWLLFHLLSTLVCLVVRPRPDVIIAPSPPLTIGLSAWVIARVRRAHFIYNVQEIYPDIAVSLGAVRSPILIGLLERVERFVYARAAAVTVIAHRMRDRLISKGVEPHKVHVIPNFVDVEQLTPGDKRNSFSLAWSVDRDFLVTYAGNLGPAQGLETFVDAAYLLRDLRGVRCMLIGSGTREEALRERIERLQLRSCMLVPHQPYSLVPEIYAASDVCLVSQAARTGADAIPSKVYRIMACGRPIIACTDADSDLATLVRESGGGVVVPPGSSQLLADAIRDAATARAEWSEMGRAARLYVERYYTRAAISGRYDELIAALLGPQLHPIAARTQM